MATSQNIKQLLDSSAAYKKTNTDKMVRYGHAARQAAMDAKDKKNEAEALLLIGMGRYLQGDFDTAYNYYTQSLNDFEKLQDTIGMVKAYNELIILYSKQKKYEAGADVARSAIKLATQIKDKSRLATAHSNYGLLLYRVKNYQDAQDHLEQAYLLCAELKDTVGMSYALDYRSSLEAETGKLDQAMNTLQEVLRLRKTTDDTLGIAIALNNIGEAFMQKKQPAAAMPYFLQARTVADSINFPDLEVYTWLMEAQAQAAMGHYQEAYEAQVAYQRLHEDLMNANKLKALEELQTKYETERKEQQNELLTKQNQLQAYQLSRRNIALAGVGTALVLAVVISVLLFSRARLRQQTRMQEEILNQQHLRTQAIIETEEHERQRLARELHDGVGQTLSAARRQIQLLQDSAGQQAAPEESLALLDESIREVRQMSHSMMPPALLNRSLPQAFDELAARLRATAGLKVQTTYSGMDEVALDRNHTLMLYRAVQEMFSNIAKHAAATTVDLELVNHGDELSLMVYDDGKGFDPAELNGQRGIGLKNIESRISFIGGILNVDTLPGAGVTYMIELPLNTHAV